MRNILLIILLACISITTYSQTKEATLSVSQKIFPESTHLLVRNLDNDSVNLKVYDMWGRTVAVFFTDTVISGNYTVSFDANKLKDGMYIVSLERNSKLHNLKIIKDKTVKKTSNDEIKIYPNPTTDWITLLTKSNVNKLEIHDINGKIILSENNLINKSINLAKYKKGVYLMHIYTSDKTFIKKIIKN